MATFDTSGSWLELGNDITPEVMQVLHYFCKDTTDRIMRNVARLNIGSSFGSTGRLRQSIDAVVYQNAGGRDALVRFYYMNYAGYLEQALGHYYGVDADLSSPGRKRRGVRHANVVVPPITDASYQPMSVGIKGIPAVGGGGRARGEVHKAKPFIAGEIRLHLRYTQRRLAMLCAYTATAYLMRGVVQGFIATKVDLRAKAINRAITDHLDENYTFDDWVRDRQLTAGIKEEYSWQFVPDMKAEDAWLRVRGYLRHIEEDWGLTSFKKGTLR